MDIARILDQYPPAARMLVTVLVAIGLFVLRTLMVMTLLTVGILAIGAIGGMIGTSLFLLGFARAFQPMREFFENCEGDWMACVLLGTSHPDRPDTCAWAWCEFIKKNRNQINVVGLCGTVSKYFLIVLEIAGTACVILDRTGAWAITLGASAMGGIGIGVSASAGVLLSNIPTVDGLAGRAESTDFTKPGFDYGLTFAGRYTVHVFSVNSGTEWGWSIYGPSGTLVLRTEEDQVLPHFRAAVCGLAYLAWNHC